MKVAEAIDVCGEWFAYLDRQRAKSKRMQELAALARTGLVGQQQAQKEMRQIDRAPTVFDGAKLEPAVRALIKAVTTDQQEGAK